MQQKRSIVKLLFFAYLAGMLWLLFIRGRAAAVENYWMQVASHIDLVPLSPTFRMLRNLWNYPEKAVLDLVIYNIGGNIGVFLPMGFLLPMAWEQYRSLWKTLSHVALAMAAVEILQALTLLGFCETDDVLLNVLGTAIGYGLWNLFFNKPK